MTILTIILSIWGALLSTILFVFKVYELSKGSYKRLKVRFHSDEYNKINTFTILNYSNNPINIAYYEAYYAKRKASKNKLHIDFGIDGDLTNVHIKPYEKVDIKLDGAYYFNPYMDRFRGKILYMGLIEASTGKNLVRKVM